MRCSHRATHPLRRGLWAGAPVPSAQGLGGTPAQPGLRPDPSGCARLRRRAFVPPPFRRRFLPASRPLLRRGPCPCARPLRGGAPGPPPGPAPAPSARPRFARLAGPALGPSPPAPPLGPCAGSCVALRVRSLAPLRLGCPRCAAASLFGRPCFVSGFPLRFGGPAGAPPWPARFAASGPGASAPGGLRGPSGRLFWPPAPRGFFVLGAPARLRYHLRRGLSRSLPAARFAGRS